MEKGLIVEKAPEPEIAASRGRVVRRRRELRKRLMRSGLLLFGQKGLDGTSVGDLVKDADTSVGAFYGLFESKESLALALIEEAIDPVARTIDRIGAEASDPCYMLAVGFRLALAIASNDPAWGRFVAQTALTEFALTHGFAPRILRDLQAAKAARLIDDENDIALLTIYSGAFLSAALLAGMSGLTPEIIRVVSRRTLIAIGVPEVRAVTLSECALPNIQIQSDILCWTNLSHSKTDHA